MVCLVLQDSEISRSARKLARTSSYQKETKQRAASRFTFVANVVYVSGRFFFLGLGRVGFSNGIRVGSE